VGRAVAGGWRAGPRLVQSTRTGGAAGPELAGAGPLASLGAALNRTAFPLPYQPSPPARCWEARYGILVTGLRFRRIAAHCSAGLYIALTLALIPAYLAAPSVGEQYTIGLPWYGILTAFFLLTGLAVFAFRQYPYRWLVLSALMAAIAVGYF